MAMNAGASNHGPDFFHAKEKISIAEGAEIAERKDKHRRFWIGIAALFLMTFLAYLPALHAQFIWDDADYLTQNPNLTDVSGLARIWTDPHSNWQYYPLVFTSFWAEYQAWGLNPLGYHLDNILLQAISAVVLWRLLKRLAIPAAWLAAAIFAVHPVQVETVAWITERKNLLCGLFYFLAMLVYFNGAATNLRQPGRGSCWAALLLFVCAMFSKTIALTWPAAIIVLIWWKHGKIRPGDIWRLIPFFVVGGILAFITTQLERQQVGAVGKDWDFGLAQRCMIAGRAVWFYAAKIVAPVRLTFIYPRWDLATNQAIGALAAVAVVAILTALIVFSRTLGRGSAAAALLFVGTLSPALGFVSFYPMRYSFVADHFAYLAIVALIVPIAILTQRYLKQFSLLLLIPLILLTWRQCQIYRDPLTLWTNTVAKNPNSWMAHVNLGQAYQAENQVDQAISQYKTATQLNPQEAEVWWKLGAVEADHGDFSDAEICFRLALEINPNDPWAKADLDKLLHRSGQRGR
jgi:hypothetical protein